jgi:hypothetical protein
MAEIRRGHVVLFVRDGRFFAHRVVGKIRQEDSTLLVTRGDRLKENDPPVSPAELLGRVTGVIRGNRHLVPSITFWRRTGSWALRRSELGTRMALRLGAREPFTWGGLVRRVYRRLDAARQERASCRLFQDLAKTAPGLSSDQSRL